MAVMKRLVTAEELERRPDDDHRYELVQGELIRRTPVGGVHGRIAVIMAARLHAYAEQHRLGEVMVEVGYRLARDPDTVRGPDVSFVAASRITEGGVPRGFIVGAPDLAVEIVSPEDTAAEVDEKVQEYLRAGSRLVWVVQPRTRTITSYRPDGNARVHGADDVIDGADVLPGFSMRVRELFPDR